MAHGQRKVVLLTIVTIWCAGSRAKLDFNFKDHSTKAEVLAAVDRIRYLGGMTNMTGGLKVARMEVFGPRYEERQNVERIIVLISDGEPNYDEDKLDVEVSTIKRMGIRIVGLGITNGVRHLLVWMLCILVTFQCDHACVCVIIDKRSAFF